MLFEEQGYTGNQRNYYDPRNSLLDHVIDSKMGIPISLSVLFAAVCRRVGVHSPWLAHTLPWPCSEATPMRCIVVQRAHARAHSDFPADFPIGTQMTPVPPWQVDLDMIGLPGHFLLATRPAASCPRVFVDAFHGGALLGVEDCKHIVNQYGIVWRDDMDAPVAVSEVWGRMVRNLLNCRKQSGDLAQVRLIQQLLLRTHRAGGTTFSRALQIPVPYPVRGSPSCKFLGCRLLTRTAI